MKKTLSFQKANKVLCSLLIALAPLLAYKTNCILVFGEPKYPAFTQTDEQ